MVDGPMHMLWNRDGSELVVMSHAQWLDTVARVSRETYDEGNAMRPALIAPNYTEGRRWLDSEDRRPTDYRIVATPASIRTIDSRKRKVYVLNEHDLSPDQATALAASGLEYERIVNGPGTFDEQLRAALVRVAGYVETHDNLRDRGDVIHVIGDYDLRSTDLRVICEAARWYGDGQ